MESALPSDGLESRHLIVDTSTTQRCSFHQSTTHECDFANYDEIIIDDVDALCERARGSRVVGSFRMNIKRKIVLSIDFGVIGCRRSRQIFAVSIWFFVKAPK